jgi:hypothetical protein
MDNYLPRTRGGGSMPRDQNARSLPRFFCAGDLSQGATRDLPEAAAHHAARVLRLAVGDAVTVFNGAGGESDARILSIGKEHVSVRVGPWRSREAEPSVRVAKEIYWSRLGELLARIGAWGLAADPKLKIVIAQSCESVGLGATRSWSLTIAWSAGQAS